MNVYDYLLGESGFLYKDFLLGNKEEMTYSELNCDSLRLARFIRENYGEHNNILLVSSQFQVFPGGLPGHHEIGKCMRSAESFHRGEQPEVYCGSMRCKNRICLPCPEGDPRWDLIEEVYNEVPEVGKGKNGFKLNLFNEDVFDEDRLAEIIFTSGSTGEPKGVMITHRNIIANTDSIIEYLKLTADDVIEIVLPFYYCYGLSLASYPPEGWRQRCIQQQLYVPGSSDQ